MVVIVIFVVVRIILLRSPLRYGAAQPRESCQSCFVVVVIVVVVVVVVVTVFVVVVVVVIAAAAVVVVLLIKLLPSLLRNGATRPRESCHHLIFRGPESS